MGNKTSNKKQTDSTLPQSNNFPGVTKRSNKKHSELKKILDKLNHKRRIKIRCKPLQDGSFSLYLDIWFNGRREYYFPRIYYFGKRETAIKDREAIDYMIALRDKKEQELRETEDGFQLSNWRAKANFIDYFESLAQKKSRGEKAWWNTLKHLKEFTGGYVMIKAIDERFCEDFKEYLLGKISVNTAHTYFSKLKAALNRAVKERIIRDNPASAIQIRKTETKREFLTLEEIEKLTVTPCKNDQVKNAFLFACWTGLRLSDIKALTWDKIQGEYLLFRQKKTGGWERMKLADNALEILERQAGYRRMGEVFHLPGDTLIRSVLKDWTKRAKIAKHVTFHTARHSFATLCLTFDIDLYTVSKLLGHKNINVTQAYAKLIDKKKDEAIDKLPKIQKMKLLKGG